MFTQCLLTPTALHKGSFVSSAVSIPQLEILQPLPQNSSLSVKCSGDLMEREVIAKVTVIERNHKPAFGKTWADFINDLEEREAGRVGERRRRVGQVFSVGTVC